MKPIPLSKLKNAMDSDDESEIIKVINETGYIEWALETAIGYNDNRTVYLIVNNKDLKKREITTGLIYASKYGNEELVEFFIDLGALMTVDVMIAAAVNGHLNIVKYLIGKEYSTCDLVSIAAKGGHYNVLEYCIMQKLYKTEDIPKIILNGIEGGNIEIVKYLMGLGIDIDNYGHSMLKTSAMYDRLDIFIYLESLEIDITANNNEIIVASCRCGHNKVFEYILTKNVNIMDQIPKLLTLMAQYGHVNLAKKLMTISMPQVNILRNMMYISAHNGHYEFVRYLLESGVAPTYSALIECCEHGNYEIAELLISNGVNVTDGYYECIHVARHYHHDNIVELLLANGARFTEGD